jgi:hypothetical protein
VIRLLQALPGVPGVRHGFTTREGGVSEGALATLNLARRPTEEPAHLEENWRRVLATLEPSLHLDDLALVDQEHGATVLEVDAGRGPLATCGRADALLTTTPGVVLGIRTADCVPVLLAHPRGVAAVHAGWRGVAANIVPLAVRRLRAIAGPGPVVAAIGPHISVEAYEVGPEVVAGIASTGVPEARFVRGRHVDLREAVGWQLASVGVEEIGHVRRCTATDPELFSHRGDGPSTGRLAAVVVRCS